MPRPLTPVPGHPGSSCAGEIRPRGRFGRLGSRSGQAFVEFLMVIPPLLLLVVGILEFGTAWRTSQVVTNTAREGARIAVLPAPFGSEANVLEAIDWRLGTGGLNPDLAEVEILCEAGSGAVCFNTGRSGTPMEVRIQYPHTFIFLGPVIRLRGGEGGDQFGTVPVRARVVMRNE